MARAENLILIGMPASGKSTLGALTAQALGWDFLDTDVLITTSEGQPLKALLAALGRQGFRRLETDHVLRLDVERTVIATGGSVVYSLRARAALRRLGRVVWLRVGLAELARRLGDLKARGVIHRPGQTLEELYAEREPLYARCAHAVLDCDGRAPEALVAELVRLAGQSPHPPAGSGLP